MAVQPLKILALLSAQLILTSCISTETIKKPPFAPLLRNQPLDDEELMRLKENSPKDAVFADLLQAFALMRNGDIERADVQKKVFGLLAASVSSFEDMRDPINFSIAFSADESKDYRGRSHERVLTSTMAAIFLMAEGRFGEAMPYLRNAEFLDARFHRMPFGTDVALIFALMYRCLKETGGRAADMGRAAQGVFRSVRFLTLQGPLIDALVLLSSVDLRSMAVANRLAYMIYEISIYNTLMSAPDHLGVDGLLDDAAKNASIFISALGSHFEEEYKELIKPLVIELARAYGKKSKDGLIHLESLTFDRVASEADDLAKKLKAIFEHHQELKGRMEKAVKSTKGLSEKIIDAASADRMAISFTGTGPATLREGSYGEITTVKPGPDADTDPDIRTADLKINTGCGFHRGQDGGFSVVLCRKGGSSTSAMRVLPSLELLSLSRKAQSVQGRQFDKVLKGRALFRASTEKIAEVSIWSAFFLFHLGSETIAACQRQGEGQACHAKGYALWAAGGITAIFSGAAWLIGRASNPSADSRYIHSAYESAWISLLGDGR